MTVKGKRVRSLPIMDAPAWSSGQLVDESLSLEAKTLIEQYSSEFGQAFPNWFSCRIGIYRSLCSMCELPTTTQEINLVQEAQQYLLETRKRLEHLPPTTDAYINETAWRRHGRLFSSGLLRDFQSLSIEIDSLLAIAVQSLNRLPKKAGRKTKSDRDELLSDIADYLVRRGLTKRRAASLAGDLLAAAGIDVPDDPIELERLARSPRGKNGT